MTKVTPLMRAAAGILSAALICTQVAAQDTPEDHPSLSEIVDAWLASPHADLSSESFTHWNEDGEIPGSCAVCHSSTGAVAYFRSDMAQPGILPHSVPTGTTVGCVVCHTSDAEKLQVVPFPSGVSVATFGPSVTCAVCHQGRASTQDVESAVSGLEEDVIASELSFTNVHYAPASATLMGGDVQGGYEYPGKSYKGQFMHVPEMSTCVDCHQPHTLEVALDDCTTCHKNIDGFADIRTSLADFDGNEDVLVGIAAPIAALHDRLGQAIQLYGIDIASAPIVYGAGSYPYFFNDSNADGVASDDEAAFPNRYQSWTPRLLKAAYNYQVVAKDKAIHMHNPHYALQLLYDSLESLSEQVEVDFSGLKRP